MKNIKFSPTFSILIVVIVCSVFLFPNILSSIKLKQFEDQLEADFEKHANEILIGDNQILQSLGSIQIKDENFRACIRSEIDKYIGIHPDSRVSSDAIELIKTLNCQRRGIASIDGIEDLKHLSHLDLSDNPLTSIKSLENLTELKSLHLNKVRLRNNNELFSLKYLNRLSPPILSEAYCQDIEKWSKELPVSLVAYVDSNYDCKGGSSVDADISRLLAKQALGVDLSIEEEILVLEYKINQQKKSYSEGNYKVGAAARLLTAKQTRDDVSGQKNSSTTKACEGGDCNSIKKEGVDLNLPKNAIKVCFTRSFGEDGSAMFIKEGQIRSSELAYSCYIPVSSAKSRFEIVAFKKACKRFVKNFLECSDYNYSEDLMVSLNNQFRGKPKMLTVYLHGVKNIALELNH